MQVCQTCYAAFRVSFYWTETDEHPDGTVSARLTTSVTPHLVAMRGTDTLPSRCIALDGEIGLSVSCTICPLRSSTCHDCETGSEKCNRARQHHGLPEIA
ncbi:MAG: YkgJ family cysteine cluster protein [Propionivibrio sp.]